MKKKILSKLIQKPLRFHHQDIHEEIDFIKNELEEIKTMLNQILNWSIGSPQDKG